jgi:ankyrin repeat protein
MVRLLIKNGANVQERCVGRFFLPNDQKDRIMPHTECPRLPTRTNYHGLSYFGEYPLTFAALLNQEECVRILARNKANLNSQDSNGNTALHMLIIYNNPVIFKSFFLSFFL